MSIEIINKSNQTSGSFDDGSIIENKPIGFPQESKKNAFSNIFYWANASSEKGGLIDLHPHKGFEIASFVLEGEIQHFDTANNKWFELEEGDVQLIKAGSGINHAERLMPGSRIFQIWFDPGLQNTMNKPASYYDYKATNFHFVETPELSAKIIKKGSEGIPLESHDITIMDITYKAGNINISKALGYYFSLYVISGKCKINGQSCRADDAIFIENEDLEYEFETETRIFQIQSPKELPYKTYLELMRF